VEAAKNGNLQGKTFNSYDLKSEGLQLGHWEPPQHFASPVSVNFLFPTEGKIRNAQSYDEI
jgi:hypothetical protein